MTESKSERRRRRRYGRILILLCAVAVLMIGGACADDERIDDTQEGQTAAAQAAQQEQPREQTRPAVQQQRSGQDQQQAEQQAAEYEMQQAAEAEAMEAQQSADYDQQVQAAEYDEQVQAASDSSSRPRSSEQRSPPRDASFRDYPRARLTAACEDNVATFSLDVDRTSYRLALNWALAGLTIDPDSVRAEEWINAFDYRYEHPAGDQFFAIAAEAAQHPLDDRLQLVRVSFQAPELPDDRPLNVTLVLDASGSMAWDNRVAIARAAAESIRSGLRDQDRIAVVQFTTDVVHDVTVRPTHPGEPAVRRSIDALTPLDSTNVQAGLDLGVRLADRMRNDRPDAFNYVILMSDGVANVDATDPFAILERVSDPDDRNPLRLITIGVGIEHYNDVLLEQLAQHGNGWYRYLGSPAEARATFSRANWLALSRPFADQARAQLTWDPQVVGAWRMIGYENRVPSDRSFTENRREFAEIPIGAAATVFFELELLESARERAIGAVNLGRVELRWVTPLDRELRAQQSSLAVSTGAMRPIEQTALLEFGSIVALAADRYSSLPHVEERGAAAVRSELLQLVGRLDRLAPDLDSLQAYHDFHFLLLYMIAGLPEERASGYSR